MGGYPALYVNPPQDPTIGLERAQQFSAMRQQMALRQQQLQSGQLGIQQQQQQLKDQQAMTAAWKDWDGKSPDSLIQGVLKNGGSGAAANQLDQQMMARQQQHMQLDEGQFQLQQKKTDRMLGRFTAAEGVSDDKLSDHVQSAIQESVQAGDLNPQEAQAGYQLLQQTQGNPKALRDGLDAFQKSHMLDSQIAARAKEQSETQKNQAEAQAKEQQTKFYQGVGLAEGVTPDMASYAAFLQKGGKPEGWAGYKAGQEAAATQPYKIATSLAEVKAKQLLEGMAKPGYAFNPATGQTQLTDQTAYLQSGGQLQAFRPVTEKEVSGDAMLINRLGDVHQKLTEYEQALQKPVSAADKRNMAALLGTDVKAAGATA